MTQAQPAPRSRWRPGRVSLAIGLSLTLGAAAAVFAATARVARERAAREAFPMVAGQLRIDGLTDRVGIDRDARGIPHVLAALETDAWLGLGFVHAQDRLAQMLWLRRIARGRTAERVGEAGLATDRLVRTIGLSRLAERAVADLDADSAVVLEAYAAGVNARLARIRAGRVAPPVRLREAAPLLQLPGKRFAPEPDVALSDEGPWLVADSLAIWKLIAWAAGASHERAVVLSDLIERLGSMGARRFFPGGERELGLVVPVDDPESLRRSARGQPRAETFISQASLRASAWAVPASLSASGAPLLVAEISVRPSAPSLLYEAHVRGGDVDAAGVTVPGLPIFWAGRNPEVSWGAAPLAVATVDLFKESIRRAEVPSESSPASEPRRTILYQNGSRWVPVDERHEEIAVGPPGSPDHRVEQLRVRETRHGPLINTLLDESAPRAPLALSWTGARPGDPVAGMLALLRADSGDDVRAALARHQEPPLEVVWAERSGGVGLQVAGWLPQRTLPSGLSPVPGRLRAFDWRARIDAEALPRLEVAADADPQASPDWLATTGGRRPAALSGVHLEWLWQSDARSERVRALVADVLAAGPVDLRQVAALQRDVAANADAQLVGALLRLAGRRPELSPEGEEVAELLRSWDGMAETDSRGAAAFQLLIGHLLEELLEPTIGAELMDRYLALPRVDPGALVQSIVLSAARSGQEGGGPDRVSAAVRESLRRTWMSLSYRLGHNRERWTWGRLHEIAFHPFDATAPYEPSSASIRAFALPGQARSIARAVPDRKTFATRRASTFRMAVDLASPDRMLTNLAPGQSEHPGHDHFADGVGPWRESRPSLVVTSRFLLEEASVEHLVLEPAR